MDEQNIELYEGCSIKIKSQNEIRTGDMVKLKELGFDLLSKNGSMNGLYECYINSDQLNNVLSVIAVSFPEDLDFSKVTTGKIKDAIYLFFQGSGFRFQS